MSVPTITPPPEAPNRDTHSNDVYSGLMDAFLEWLVAFAVELAAVITWISDQVTAIAASVTAASNSASAAADSAAAAGASATAAASVAPPWVSGGSYTLGETAYSPVNLQTYRARTTHSGVADDPSADPTNWALLGADPEAIQASARRFSLWNGA